MGNGNGCHPENTLHVLKNVKEEERVKRMEGVLAVGHLEEGLKFNSVFFFCGQQNSDTLPAAVLMYMQDAAADRRIEIVSYINIRE